MSAKPAAARKLPNAHAPREVLAYHMRRLRVALGWSQERLAFECELDRTYVSALERCVWNVSLANIERIAKALDVPVWHLLCPPAELDKLLDRV